MATKRTPRINVKGVQGKQTRANAARMKQQQAAASSGLSKTP